MKYIVSFILGVILTLIFVFQSPKPSEEKDLRERITELENKISEKQLAIDSSKNKIIELSDQQDSIRIIRDTILKPIYAKIEEAEYFGEDTSKKIIIDRFKTFNRTLNFILNADAIEIKYHSLQQLYEKEHLKLKESLFINEIQEAQLELKDEIIEETNKIVEIKQSELRKSKSNNIKFALGGVALGGAAVLIFKK